MTQIIKYWFSHRMYEAERLNVILNFIVPTTLFVMYSIWPWPITFWLRNLQVSLVIVSLVVTREFASHRGLCSILNPSTTSNLANKAPNISASQGALDFILKTEVLCYSRCRHDKYIILLWPWVPCILAKIVSFYLNLMNLFLKAKFSIGV